MPGQQLPDPSDPDSVGSATFDTRLSYRGTSCPGTSTQCVDDSCGVLQTQLVQLVPAGTHYFAVHTFYSGTTAGAYGLTYGVYAAASGSNTLITPTPTTGTAMTFTGTTSGTGRVDPSCTGGGTAPENSYYWLQCPSDSRSYSANTCTGTNYDSVIYLRLNGASIACNDDGCGYPYSSFTGAASTGAGVVQLFVDGYSSIAGNYSCAVTF